MSRSFPGKSDASYLCREGDVIAGHIRPGPALQRPGVVSGSWIGRIEQVHRIEDGQVSRERNVTGDRQDIADVHVSKDFGDGDAAIGRGGQQAATGDIHLQRIEDVAGNRVELPDAAAGRR